jgi:hypothetical protein
MTLTPAYDLAKTPAQPGDLMRIQNGSAVGQILLSAGAVTIATNNDKANYTLASTYDRAKNAAAPGEPMTLLPAGVQSIWDAAVAALTTPGSIGQRIVSFLTGDIFARLGPPATASIAGDLALISTGVVGIKSKTDSLPADPASQAAILAKLPASLTANGLMRSDALRINGSDTAASGLELSAEGLLPCVVDATAFDPTTGEFEVNINEGLTNHFLGRGVLFYTGALKDQGATITASTLTNGRTHLSVTKTTVQGTLLPLTAPPSPGDQLFIV